MRLCLVIIASLACVPSRAQQDRINPGSFVGACDVERWKQIWPGCKFEDGVSEGHLSICKTEEGSAFRVDYAIGGIGPEDGGVGWRYPITKSDAVELQYKVTFSPNFQWVKGGKLPGLGGGTESVTGGNRANGKNGFSARLMWRADGRGEAYVYHMNQPKTYGESFRFPDGFRFPTGVACQVKMRVSMNAPGKRNGTLDVWVGESLDALQLVVSRSDMQWRSTPSISIDSLLFQTFHGGGDKSWAPQAASYSLFRDITTRSLE